MKTFIACLILLTASPSLASDPNQVCADSRDQLQSVMMEDSQVVKNMKLFEPLTLLVMSIRKKGVEDGVTDDALDAIRAGRKPLSSGEDGYRALQVVESIYESCRKGSVVRL